MDKLMAFDWSGRRHRRCLVWLKEGLEDPYIKSLLQNMKENGCAFPVERFICEPCGARGLYDIERKEVVLCEDNMTTKQGVGDTLSHELIHAFDDYKISLDNTNLKQMACTEIRAVNLQKNNRIKNIDSFHKAFIRGQVLKNMLEHGNIDKKQAESAVDLVFEECFNDYQPFGKQRTRIY